MQSILEILTKTTAYFESKGISEAKLEAQILLAHSLGCKRLELFLRFDEPLTEEKLSPFREMVRRRAKREPLQYIVGSCEFCGIKIKCDSRALIPRPETEELCDYISESLGLDKSAELKILDLGTGTGAIALSLLNAFQNAVADAMDASASALSLAKENAESLGLDSRANFIESNWYSILENTENKYDLIISNPPYLTKEELDSSLSEVKDFEPHSALIAPDAGLADLKQIIQSAPKYLKSGGILACECGLNQTEILCDFALQAGFSKAESKKDFSGRNRFLICAL